MKQKNYTLAVSEIVGTMLLLLIAISAFTVIYFGVLSDDGPPPETFVKIKGMVEGTNIILEHQGGEPLKGDSWISIDLPGEDISGPISEFLHDENSDGFWNIGERLLKPFTYNLSILGEYTVANVTAVDTESNAISFTGPVSFNPVSDLGIEVTVNNSSPQVGTTVKITITVTSYGGDVDGCGNVKIRYVIPEGLEYISNSPSQGSSYDHTSGLWDAGNVLVGTPATLDIIANATGVEIREFVQLAMVLDGSGSISSGDWLLMKTGLANAVEDEDAFPHDGTVELTVIQFGVDHNECTVEIPPTIVNSSNFQSIADYIDTLIQGDGGTPMAAGIYLAADIMKDSSNYDYIDRQVITLVTDGEPTYWSNFDEYIGYGDGYYVDDKDIQTTETARNYSIDHLLMTDEKDEFNSLAVGSGPDVTWLNGSIVWPEPGYIWDITSSEAPTGTGWVAKIDTFADFEYAIDKMFKLLFSGITNTVEYVDSTTWDPNYENNNAAVIILPEE